MNSCAYLYYVYSDIQKKMVLTEMPFQFSNTFMSINEEILSGGVPREYVIIFFFFFKQNGSD